MSNIIKIGLLGLGTIGTGVARIFFEQNETFAREFRDEVQLARIADLDTSDRGIAIPNGVITDDAMDVIGDPEISVIVELVGGIEPARSFVLAAIDEGKHVVTANKALLAAHGDEISRAAAENGVDVLFEASVGGSIPILRALRESLFPSRIQSIYGILNGTTNYILTRMTLEGGDYDSLLKNAQEQGFAERDPTSDVSGSDSLQKLTLLLRLGFRAMVEPGKVLCEGIETITPLDIAYAGELGYTIKLLAVAKRHHDGQVEARVHPAMIPQSSVLANVNYEYNAIEVVGDLFGSQIFYGKGAGQSPTATVVVSDALDIAARVKCGNATCRVRNLLPLEDAPKLKRREEMLSRHYVRMEVSDQAGVLELIAREFARHAISIETVHQKGRSESETVPLVIVTHEASETNMERAMESLRGLLCVRPPIQHIRIENPA